MSRLKTPFLLVLLLTSPAAWAQTTSQLKGQVRQGDGTALPGVTVTVSSDALLGGSRVTTTGPNGGYVVHQLPPGSYSVKAELEGFQPRLVEEVRAKLGSTTAVNFTLTETETFGSEVTVTGEPPLVDLTSSAVGYNYNAEFIEDLPLNRVGFWDMIGTAPGVSLNFADEDPLVVAYGSGVSRHNWMVDGAVTVAPKFGSPWIYPNPDNVAEVQVLGVGVPAEYGGMTGAAFNVVTKSGGNDLTGSVKAFWQDDSLTDSNVTLEGSPFPEFELVKWHDVTATLGGAFQADKSWFFAALETRRDQKAGPGEDPAFAPLDKDEKLDLKLNNRVGDRHSWNLKLAWAEFETPLGAGPNVSPESTRLETGTNPFVAADWTSIASPSTFVEAKYSWWWGDDTVDSLTGSTEPLLILRDEEGNELFTNGSGQIIDFENWSEQASVVASHFAEDFAGGDHDFKFGVQYSHSEAESLNKIGPQGAYYVDDAYYGYGLYQVYQQPYAYGTDVSNLGLFVDDSWQVGDRLTLNAGVRYDNAVGDILSVDVVDRDSNSTGERVPGVPNAVEWSHVSPRFGFAYTLGPSTVLRGSAGLYHGAIVSANWDSPPPSVTPVEYFLPDANGDFSIGPVFVVPSNPAPIDPDLEAPSSFQLALGFERQVAHYAFGAQVIYKETQDMVGWELLDDGVFEPFTFTDNLTGEEVEIWREVVAPTKRIGNDPGFTIAGPDAEYASEYKGLILTFNKRFTNGWDLAASYTLSKSEGLQPNPRTGAIQEGLLFGNPIVADANTTYNAHQLLQGDRKHMLRVHASFKLPWGLNASAVVNLMSGTPHGRVIRRFGTRTDFPFSEIIVEPASDDMRIDSQTLVDMSLGKRFELGNTVVKVDAQVLNLLNDDAVNRLAHWRTNSAGEFTPRSWLAPRRLLLRLAIEF